MTHDLPIGPVIRMSGVTKNYETPGGVVRALRGVTCRVNAGELLGIVGKSGSGKSTLLNMMTGIDRPTGGEIEVAGTRIHELGESQRAAWRGRTVGIVFQFFQLLPTLTVVENVMLPMDFCDVIPKPERRRRAEALLSGVGVVDQAGKLPLELSGGQQQRVAIARALANDPPLLVADEPTGNLDGSAGAVVWGLFSSLAAGGTAVVVVTHDSEVSRWAKRVLTIADGVLLPEGETAETARKERIYA